jgi:hypothetical protein
MSSTNVFGNEVSVDEQAFEKHDEAAVGEDGFVVVDETPEFRATVDMEVQAKVDSNHPDARVEAEPDHLFGKTLEQEERINARETELERISAQAELGTQEGRETRTRDIARRDSQAFLSIRPTSFPADDTSVMLTSERKSCITERSLRRPCRRKRGTDLDSRRHLL